LELHYLSALTQVAFFAEKFNILLCVISTLRNGNYVIEMDSFAAAAPNTSPAISRIHAISDFCRDISELTSFFLGILRPSLGVEQEDQA
jgi:hypothetical protein